MHGPETEASPVPKRRRAPRAFGTVRKLPSGRFQASYLGPGKQRVTAPETFRARVDADRWLAKAQTAMAAGTWREPTAGQETFGAYGARWLVERDLKPRTRAEYDRLMTRLLAPTFGGSPLVRITPAMVRSWYAKLPADKPTQRARAYGLLSAVMRSAVLDDVIAANPCRVRAGGQAKRAKTPRPASLPELETLTAAMPDRLQLMVLLAAWCALRFGELVELRRGDVDLLRGRLLVERGATRVRGRWVVGDPKSEAGRREVAIPPHLLPVVVDHLGEHVDAGVDARLFYGTKGGYLSPSSLYEHYYPAREAAGRPDLTFHDLRHTGATLAAATGATLAELMARLGHSTPQAAMRYQHAAADRDAAIASALSDIAAAKAVPLRPVSAR